MHRVHPTDKELGLSVDTNKAAFSDALFKGPEFMSEAHA